MELGGKQRKKQTAEKLAMAKLSGRRLLTLTSGSDGHSNVRTRSRITINHLPTEVLNLILTGIHIRDLLAVRQVCKLFHEITDIPSLWKQASFCSVFPSTPSNLDIFVKAASYDNFEAAVKLAVARLYNDGLPEDQKQMSVKASSALAAGHFYQAQRLAPAFPFIWLLLRPPWAPTTLSLKGCTSQKLLEGCHSDSNGAVTMSMAHLLQLTERPAEAIHFTMQAASSGCHEAQLLHWKHQYAREMATSQMSVARELTALRELRVLASDIFSQLLLCSYYAAGRFGGIGPKQAMVFSRQVFQNSSPFNILPYVTVPHRVTASIRYILIDWMADVASMPTLALSHHALLCAVDMVDRCIVARSFGIGNLQLLGVAALVITSRYMSENILTVTNAVASTASTWTYSEVVQMIGEVIAILKGQIRGVTSLDFAFVLEKAVDSGEMGRQVGYFILALCMLQPSLTVYSPAHVASCAVLLARTLTNCDEVWPAKLQEVTGFSMKDLIPCAFAIHHKCLLEDIQYDPNGIPMKGVRLRFSEENSAYDMSLLKIPSYKELQERLGVARPITYSSRSKLRVRSVEDLICSPSRGRHRHSSGRSSSTIERPSRDDAATPPLDLDTSGYQGDCDYDTDPFDLSESFCSAQSDDTDLEPMHDSFLEEPDAHHHDWSISSASPQRSRIAISSPQGIMVNISNPSFSLSMVGSASANNSGASSVHTLGAGSPHLNRCMCQFVPQQNLEEDQVVPCREDCSDAESVSEMSCAADAPSCNQQQSNVQVQLDTETDCEEELPSSQVTLPYPVMESSSCHSEQQEDAHPPQRLVQSCCGTVEACDAGDEVCEVCEQDPDSTLEAVCDEQDPQYREKTQDGFNSLGPLLHQQHEHSNRGPDSSDNVPQWNREPSIGLNPEDCMHSVSMDKLSALQCPVPEEGTSKAVDTTMQVEELSNQCDREGDCQVSMDVQDHPGDHEDFATDPGTGNQNSDSGWYCRDNGMGAGGSVSAKSENPSHESPITFGSPIAESSPLKRRTRARGSSSGSNICVSLLFGRDPTEEQDDRSPSDSSMSERRKRGSSSGSAGSLSPPGSQKGEEQMDSPSAAKRKTLNTPQVLSPDHSRHR